MAGESLTLTQKTFQKGEQSVGLTGLLHRWEPSHVSRDGSIPNLGMYTVLSPRRVATGVASTASTASTASNGRAGEGQGGGETKDGVGGGGQAAMAAGTATGTGVGMGAASEDDMGGMEMEWLLLTSANMSQRSWGSLTKAKNKLRVLSFELGVMFLPRLCGAGGLAELAVEEIEDSHQVGYLVEAE